VDAITDIAFREPFGMLHADDDVNGYITTQEHLIPIFEWFGAFPILAKIVKTPFIAKHVMPKPTDKDGIGFMLGVAKDKVDQRFGPGKVVKDDMLGSFIKHGLDQKQCQIEAPLQVIAGTDTTVSSFRAVSMYIISNPRVYAKVQAEIDAAKLTSLIVTDSEARDLVYLQACIKEGMRMFPPVTGLFSKRVPAGGDTIHGKFIPEGTQIAYAAWDFYKDPSVFGPDAGIFRPERWLEASEEQLTAMTRVTDLVFGYGKYQCLGKPIALLELGKALGEVSCSICHLIFESTGRYEYF
jgi:cytochrome P450